MLSQTNVHTPTYSQIRHDAKWQDMSERPMTTRLTSLSIFSPLVLHHKFTSWFEAGIRSRHLGLKDFLGITVQLCFKNELMKHQFVSMGDLFAFYCMYGYTRKERDRPPLTVSFISSVVAWLAAARFEICHRSWALWCHVTNHSGGKGK